MKVNLLYLLFKKDKCSIPEPLHLIRRHFSFGWNANTLLQAGGKVKVLMGMGRPIVMLHHQIYFLYLSDLFNYKQVLYHVTFQIIFSFLEYIVDMSASNC